MSENQQKDSTGESMVFGMSLRGIITIILTITVCVLCPWKNELIETLKYGFCTTIGFFFAQKTQKPPA